MFIYRCEDTLESIFTAIYNVYEDKRSREDVFLALDDEPRLFSTVINVNADEERCQKVIRTLKRRFGMPDYERICLALAATDEDKAQAVYGTIAIGLASGCGPGHLFDNLADAQVYKAFSLARTANREYGHLREFVRFEELESGILYSKFEPKSNVLTFLMPHFADRFPQENFVMHDVGRELFGIHLMDGDWFLLQGEENMTEKLILSADEIKYRELFKHFCKTIAIDERKNLKLQTGMLPKYYRKYMSEFQ